MAKKKNAHAMAVSKLGVQKGGKARGAGLPKMQRSEIFRRAILARWTRAKKLKTTKKGW